MLIEASTKVNLLFLARDILVDNARAKKTADAGTNEVYPFGDVPVTTEEIVAEAKKLEEFVRSR